jgi:MFS family permease
MAALFLTIALSTVTIGVSSTVLPLYVLSLGGTPADWGAMYACFAIAMGLAEMVIGTLSDRFGVRRAMAASRAISGLITVWLALLPGLGAIYLIQGLRGGADAAIWPLGKSHIGRTVPAELRATHLGLFTMMSGLGTSIGAVAGGLALGAVGFVPAFFIATVASLAAAGVAWGGMTEAPQHTAAKPHLPGRAVHSPVGTGRWVDDTRSTVRGRWGYFSRFLPLAVVTVIIVAAWG